MKKWLDDALLTTSVLFLRSLPFFFTSDIVPIRLIEFLDPSISKGEFSHPIDAASDAGRQAEAGVGGGGVEPVGGEIVAG